MAENTQIEVAVLKQQTKTLHEDLAEMKLDVKEIKELLSGSFVTKEEFDTFRKSQRFYKVVIATITAVITAIITIEITKYIK